MANEVKNLASQTTKATEEIGQQISGVQSATGDAVTATRRIARMIAEVNAISTGIAATISRTVAQATGTTGTTGTTGAVAQATGTTGAVASSAGLVTRSEGALADQAETLRTEVQVFVSEIRQG